MSISTRVTLNHAVQVFYLSFFTYFLHILFLFFNLKNLRNPILLNCFLLLDATLFFCTHLIDDLLRDFEDFLAFVCFLFTELLLDATLFFCTHLIEDLLRDFEDFLTFVCFLFTERLLYATLFFCTHLIEDLLLDFEDCLSFVWVLFTEFLLDANLFFCTHLIDDLLRDFEDFLNFNTFLLVLRFFEDTLFFCCRFIDIRLTHRLFRDLDLLLFIKIFESAFLVADLLFSAVLRLIVTRAFLVVRPILLFFEEMDVFFTETLLHMFFFSIPRDFNVGTFDVLLHLLFTFVFTILLGSWLGVGIYIIIVSNFIWNVSDLE